MPALRHETERRLRSVALSPPLLSEGRLRPAHAGDEAEDHKQVSDYEHLLLPGRQVEGEKPYALRMQRTLRLTAMVASLAWALTACAASEDVRGEQKAQQADAAPPSALAPSVAAPDVQVLLGGITGYGLRDDTERAAELMASGVAGSGPITGRQVVLGSKVVASLTMQQADRPLTAAEVDQSISVTEEALSSKGEAMRQPLGAVDALKIRLHSGGTFWALGHSYFVATIVSKDEAIADDVAKQLARLLEQRG